MQTKQIHFASPHLFSVNPKGQPTINTYMKTFTTSANFESQLCFRICHQHIISPMLLYIILKSIYKYMPIPKYMFITWVKKVNFSCIRDQGIWGHTLNSLLMWFYGSNRTLAITRVVQSYWEANMCFKSKPSTYLSHLYRTYYEYLRNNRTLHKTMSIIFHFNNAIKANALC